MCPRKFTLRVDNQALSWLKTYSTDQALIVRWITALEKYHFHVEYRPRTQHRNADGPSKRTNDYRWRDQQLERLPPWPSTGTSCRRTSTNACKLRHGSTFRDGLSQITLTCCPTCKICNLLLPTQFCASFVARNEPNDEPSNKKHFGHRYRHSFHRHYMPMRTSIPTIRKTGSM